MSEEIKEELEEVKEEVVEETTNLEDDIKIELEKVKKELEESKKDYMLKLAEFQNFSKRKEKELQEFKEFANREIILKFLDNLDNLERAINASKETENYKVLVEGLEMAIKNSLEVLKGEGVEEVDTENAPYNANEHYAVSTVNEEDKENNEIVQVFQKGYKLKGRVIRPSMVVINKKENK